MSRYDETSNRKFIEFLGSGLDIKSFMEKTSTQDLVEMIIHALDSDIDIDIEMLEEYKLRRTNIPDEYKIELLLLEIDTLIKDI